MVRIVGFSFGTPRVAGGWLAWVLAGVMAGGAWAAEINVANPTASTGVTVSGNDITINTQANNSTITGFANGKRLILQGSNLNVTFKNLTIIGDKFPAVNIGEVANTQTSTHSVTITLEGNNTLSGGIGGAGLRVPEKNTLTIGGSGTLTAIGGQWRSFINADAGAGIGGGNVTVTNPSTYSVSDNMNDNCGTVTINGGTIFAYGGGSGESGNSQGGDAQGVAGSRWAYAAGIGGSGNAANGCDLTINGGNVTAVGGKPGKNDIGPGYRYTDSKTDSDPNVASPTATGKPGTTKINGGSVNANIPQAELYTATGTSTTSGASSGSSNMPAVTFNGVSKTQITCNNGCGTNTAADNACTRITGNYQTVGTPRAICTSGTCSNTVFSLNGIKLTGITVSTNCTWINNYSETKGAAIANSGNTALSQKQIVVGGSANTETRDKPVTTCNFDNTECVSSSSSEGYGIKDVKTDANQMLYFWLPTTYSANSQTDKITLDIGGTKKEYKYTSSSSGNLIFVGPTPSMEPPAGERNVDGGAYETGFAAPEKESYYAALKGTIKLIKGTYIQNDADIEGNHEVYWFRKDSDGTETDIFSSSSQTLSGSSGSTVSYSVQTEDYGKEIYAKVRVKDKNGLVSSGLVDYPGVKVGVVVKDTVIAGLGVANSLVSGKNITIKQRGSSIDTNGLIIDIDSPLSLALSGFQDNRYTFYYRIGRGGEKIPLSIPKDNDGKNINVIGNEDDPNTERTFYLSSASGVSDTIFFIGVVKDGSQPRLNKIEFFNNSSSSTAVYTINIENYVQTATPENGRIPRSGKIKLTFSSAISNKSTITDGVVISTTINGESAVTISNSSTNNVDEFAEFTYGSTENFLSYKQNYILSVKNFKNVVETAIVPIDVHELKVERPAVYTLSASSHYDETDFLVGKQPKINYSYDSREGGSLKGLCYYWEEAGQTNTSGWGREGLSEDQSGDSDGSFNSPQFNVIYCNNDATTSPELKSPVLGSSDFGKYVRLVVRPYSSNPVEGYNEYNDNGTHKRTLGEPAFADWKQVGIKLVPIYPAANTAQTYKNIMFGSCSVSGTSSGLDGCYGAGGYVIYNREKIPLRVAPQKVGEQYYDLDKWNAFYNENPTTTADTANSEFDIDSIPNPMTLNVKAGGIFPKKGTYYIKPHIVPIAPPEIMTVKISTTSGVRDISKEAITNAVVNNNELEITFNPREGESSVMAGNGVVTIKEMCTNCAEKILDCDDKDKTGMIDTVTCSLVLSAENETNPFNKSYMIVVSGYQSSTNDIMGTATYSFGTGPGPKLDKPVLKSDLKDDEYAVNHKIEIENSDYLNTYSKQAGAEATNAETTATHTYVWQRSTEKSCTDNQKCTTITSTPADNKLTNLITNGYTPVAADFGKYIRLVITPKDVNGKVGAAVESDWLRIGAKTTIALDSSQTLGNMIVRVGSTDINTATDYEVIYGDTKITALSTSPFDKFIEWSSSSSVNIDPSSSGSATFKPSEITGDVTLNAKIKDESVPTVDASYSKPGETVTLNFTVSKSVKSSSTSNTITVPTSTAAKITITAGGSACSQKTENVFTSWSYNVSSQSTFSSTYDSETGKTKGTFSLSNLSTDFSGFSIVAGCDYTLSIDGDAFVDSWGNKSIANPKLLTFNQEGIFKVAMPYDISNQYEYISTDNGTITEKTINVKNEGNTSVTLKAELGQNSKFSVSGITNNVFTLASNGATQNITIKPTAVLPAGTYTDVLTIYSTDDAKRIEQGISITYIVKPVTISSSSLSATPKSSKSYDGTTTAELTSAWTWNKGSIGDNNVNVIITGVNYSDPNIGEGKTISVNYKIINPTTNEINANYIFENQTQEYTQTHSSKSITPPAITIVFNDVSIGERYYDGSNTFQNITSIAKGTAYTLTGADNGISLDFSKALITLNGSDASDDYIHVSNIVGLALAGSGSENYTFGVDPNNGYSKLKAKINKLSLASLDANGKPKSTFAGQKGKTPQNCTVGATPVYGDLVSKYESWKGYLSTDCAVSYQDKLVVAGNWELCSKPNDHCTASLIPTKDMVTPIAAEQEAVYAQFVPSGMASYNYSSDLLVKVDLKVAPKKINVETVDRVVKVYDGTVDINKEVSLYSKDEVIEGELKNFIVMDTEANGKYKSKFTENENVGVNKYLEIGWKLKEGSIAAQKYTSGDPVGNVYPTAGKAYTYGNIDKRPLYIAGLKAKHKYYDGKNDAEVNDPGSNSFEPRTENTGLVSKDEGKVTFTRKSGTTFAFNNPNADNNKSVTPKESDAFELGGVDPYYKNYSIDFGSLRATVFQSNFANYLCKELNGTCSPEFIANDELWIDSTWTNGKLDTAWRGGRATEIWFKNNMATAVRYLIELKTGNMDSYANAVYGDLYSAVSEDLARILPSKLDSAMGASPTDPTRGSWSWMSTGIVQSVSINHQWMGAIFRHNNPNYTSDTMFVPLKIAPRQLALMDVYALPRDYKPCLDGYPNICSEDFAKEVELSYTLSGVVNDELGNNSLTVLGRVDNPNAGENREVSIASINWNGASSIYGNYLLPSAMGVSIPPVTIGRAEYPGELPPIVTKLPSLYGLNKNPDALIYDMEKYPKLSNIDFDASSAGWSWKDMGQSIRDPQLLEGEYITEVYQAEYMPPVGNRVGGINPGDIWASNPNYRPKESSVPIRIYKRSVDRGLKFANLVDPECGAETVRIKVAASNEYATIWFRDNQYYDSENAQSVGTFTVSGLEYGVNAPIRYRINAQAYGYGEDYSFVHTRMIPFTSVAKYVRGKSLTVSLDSSLLPEKTFFRKHEFDLTKTRWFKGKDSIGTGLILSVSEHSADIQGGYSLILYGKDSKPIIASCKELGGAPELPENLEYLPVSNVAKTLIATPYGSRIAMGGASLIFNTPNGGTVSIYTMKGELISRMQAVENRTIVKVPATRGIYIVKLEANK